MGKMVLIAAAFCLCACAGLPSHISVGNKVAVSGTEARFDACKMTVRFSQPPAQLLPREMSNITDVMGKYWKWEVDGFGHERYRAGEFAFCICRDSEISESEIAAVEERMRNNKQNKLIDASAPPYARKVVDVEQPFSVDGKMRLRFFFPKDAGGCMFAAAAAGDAATMSGTPAFLDGVQRAGVLK
jgi:hypothetical protein